MTDHCDHAELYPRRHPGALPVCAECSTAVLDFDVIYKTNDRGNLVVDQAATEAMWTEEDGDF